MTSSLLLAVLASGFIYGITPGPGVLAVFGIGAARGRRAGAGFLCGHLLGDVVWCSTALIAIVGAREIGSSAFDVLGVLSGLYLFWLGLRAIRSQRSSGQEPQGPARQPFWHGILFGLTNPKAYPVAVATFTALLSSRAELLNWSMLPWLIFLSFLGGIGAYAILIGIVGARRVRTLYQRHELAITRLCGVMFIGFAINALLHAVPGLLANKA
ncbi:MULTISPECIES: LysE family translocator [Pseudomonas]|jgi:threonine/homoserine/homoserine lactone efflux protein|uniref:LysE family translocator n=2 Tax=Pseudomonas chlororaphis TaxID=587753 RepID=A0AAQ0AQX7_9PSED|nr:MULTISPECIES: LysE family translocator [Pseudomonas]AIC18514.1 lysine transporter LysE [Pseudomonas chlororaphis]AUG39617.1 LysE family translocator [Pseudomonas chlororaphis]AVO57698.1 LysE family translocator [Pseudomonas chlororaphis subsp. piscium]AZD20717.1 L-lysine permease [Pseudomonas chlororaphis subsp. aurantiaca]AZD34174.1 L-lysine permease [Pseudomonas chlororaphis subsp. aurantiaca]